MTARTPVPSHVTLSFTPITPRKGSPKTFKVTKAQTLFVNHRITELEVWLTGSSVRGSTELCKVMLHRKVSGTDFTAFNKPNIKETSSGS